MIIGKVGSSNFGKALTYAQTKPYENENDKGILTQYFDKNGKLVGFRRVHENGMIERAYQYPDGTILITRKYNRHQPARVKGIDAKGNFHPEIAMRNILGHNPNRRVVEEKWAEEELLNLKA